MCFCLVCWGGGCGLVDAELFALIVWAFWGLGFGGLLLMESLILAQDERWRRA